MPTDLAALLAETGAVAADGLEQARARQRERGGALDTALLELGLLSDDALGLILARATGLPLAPAGHLEVDVRARRVFPARIAERHGLAPFRLEGRELSLIAAAPVDRAALDEIGFMLSLDLAVCVAPEWRVRELAARVYGEPLPERFAALAARPAAQTSILQPPAGFEEDAALEDLAFSIDEDLTGYTLRPAEDAPALFPIPEAPPGLSPLLASVETPATALALDVGPALRAPADADPDRSPRDRAPAPGAAIATPLGATEPDAASAAPAALDVEHAALTVALEALEPAALLDVPPHPDDAGPDGARQDGSSELAAAAAPGGEAEVPEPPSASRGAPLAGPAGREPPGQQEAAEQERTEQEPNGHPPADRPVAPGSASIEVSAARVNAASEAPPARRAARDGEGGTGDAARSLEAAGGPSRDSDARPDAAGRARAAVEADAGSGRGGGAAAPPRRGSRRRPAPVIIPPLRIVEAGAAPQRDGAPVETATLETATTRDAVVRAALEGAHRVFEAAALFAVTHERLAGQDAAGWPGARERARRADLPLAQGGILRTAVETQAPYVGPVARESGNVALLAALGRPWPRLVVAYPVLVRGRVVAVLYADHGDADVEPRQVEEALLAFAGVGAAFDRVLRAAKRLRALSPPMGAAPAAPPSVEHTAAPSRDEVAAPATAPSGGIAPQAPAPAAAQEDAGAPAVDLAAAPGAGPVAAVAPYPQGAPPGPGPSVEEPPPEIIDLDLSGPETWSLLEPGALAELEAPGPVAADPFGLAPAAEVLAAHAVEAAELVRRVCATLPGAARESLTTLLVRRGPEAAAALAAASPGPVDPRAPGEAGPAAGPVLGALELLGPVATPYLVELLREEDPVRRRRAVEVLGRTHDAAAFLPLADRTLDLDPEVAEAARGALAEVREHPDFPPVVQRLRRALAVSPPGAQSKAARALARLAPDAAAPDAGR